ncbi:lysophospholipid acyltransferase family protein [Magnetococcales bacterium HHB-1]
MKQTVWMVRSTIFSLFFLFGVLFFATLIILLVPFSSVSFRRWISRIWGGYNVVTLSWCCGLTHQVVGLENLPPPPFVIMSKHQSAWETVTFPSIFPAYVVVLKRALMFIPFFGWALKATGQIFIERASGMSAVKVLQLQGREAAEKEGMCILIFPEGTRVRPGEKSTYKAGGVNLALALGLPIVPVAHNGGLFWGKRAFVKKPGKITIAVGEAIITQGIKKGGKMRKRLLMQVEERIEGMMQQL